MIYSLSEKEQRRSYYHSTSAKNTRTLKSILKSILSTQKKELLDSMIYKDTNNKLCLTIYRKPTDRQNYFYFKSANPSSLKCILYSQALRILTFVMKLMK